MDERDVVVLGLTEKERDTATIAFLYRERQADQRTTDEVRSDLERLRSMGFVS
ncbi:MAG TPA: hypothetical protein VFJ85_19455 [Acidimicrobiales bacterium]|nr:hypothetical protein [Acidimicrobiales bacterium]